MRNSNNVRMTLRGILILLSMLCCPRGMVYADQDGYLRDQAFQAAQYALSTSAGQAITLVGLRLAADNAELGELVQQHQELSEAWRKHDAELLSLLQQSEAGLTGRADALRGESVALKQQLERLEARLETEFPDYLEMTHPKPLLIADVQSLLHADEAMVLTLVTPRVSYVWVVTKEKSAWQQVGYGSSASEPLLTAADTADVVNKSASSRAVKDANKSISQRRRERREKLRFPSLEIYSGNIHFARRTEPCGSCPARRSTMGTG